ncbi:MAG: hypothetical protein IJV06_10270 [Bacteroidaceae bacterium]|nr:hypothetical protein [Bacteroidaceae bacterium]
MMEDVAATARESSAKALSFVDRAYIYDNSINNQLPHSSPAAVAEL